MPGWKSCAMIPNTERADMARKKTGLKAENSQLRVQLRKFESDKNMIRALMESSNRTINQILHRNKFNG